jgi:antitoxin (DNA-binding transcriptional repressor) of toxin-antitoxin stability system
MIQLSVAEAQQRLPELLTAASQGEVVRIQENGSVFQLTPIQPRPRPPVTGVPKAGQFKGMFVVPDDFDEPLEELREYME